jgi:ligand-binding sensor domain-containing protein
MSPNPFLVKDCRISLVCFTLILISSCTKYEQVNNFGTKVSFDISDHLLEGKHVDCIVADNKGSVFIASDKELLYIHGSTRKSYTLEYPVLDMAVASDESLWIGSNGGGLGHLSSGVFKWYTKDNSGIPRDLITNVKVAPDGNVWFSSSAFRLGGLCVFDGNRFEILTPENSPLNQNLIDDIQIGSDGAVYIATAGTVGRSNIYRIRDKQWDCLGDEKGTFYWVFSFIASQSGLLYVVEDFSLSSAMNTNKLYLFSENKWQKLEIDFNPGFFTRMNIDRRDYLWVAGRSNNEPALHVYDGNSWVNSPKSVFENEFITSIETDSDNNVWIGTYDNGVYILKQ